MRRLTVLVVTVLAGSLGALAAPAEGSFERTLKVSGPVDLEVKTGTGNITVRPGDSGTVRVYGKIHVSDRRISTQEAEAKVRRLEANPPIEQNGNSIRIGQIEDRELRNNVSISYEVTVPAQTRLRSNTGTGNESIEGIQGPVEAATGSGNIVASDIGDRMTATTGSGNVRLDSVKGQVRATTGSGDIRAAGVGGAFTAHTGSGNVRLGQTAAGDVEVNTGSGDIELAGVRGAVRVHSGSGGITAEGEPTAPWNLEVASGNIRLRLPSQAAFDLSARTGSGRITIDHPLTVQGTLSPRRIEGKVRGGGVLLAVSTSSGNITIQ